MSFPGIWNAVILIPYAAPKTINSRPGRVSTAGTKDQDIYAGGTNSLREFPEPFYLFRGREGNNRAGTTSCCLENIIFVQSSEYDAEERGLKLVRSHFVFSTSVCCLVLRYRYPIEMIRDVLFGISPYLPANTALSPSS